MENVNLLSEFGKLILGLIGLIVVGFIAVFFGPVGLLLLAIPVIGVAAVYSLIKYGSTETDSNRMNCPACGARTSAANDSCEYCGESL